MARWDWTEEEKMLVADLQDDLGWKGFRKTTSGVRELSELLRSTSAYYPFEGRPETFRNLNGVALKANNLHYWHPSRTGKGTRPSVAEIPIVEAFLLDRERMKRVAAEIRSRLEEGLRLQDAVSNESDPLVIEAAQEGGLRAVVSYRRERDSKLREAKLKLVCAEGRPLACEVCTFDFAKTYGDRGRGYIEVHHVTPLHVSGVVQTRLEDLVLLCSNCHRMIHRSGWLRPEELKEMVQE